MKIGHFVNTYYVFLFFSTAIRLFYQKIKAQFVIITL